MYDEEWNEDDGCAPVKGEPVTMRLSQKCQWTMRLTRQELYANVSNTSNRRGVMVHEMAITYSSRMKLPTDKPPQLMPFIRLPARLSRRPRAWSRLAFIEMGLGPALTKES